MGCGLCACRQRRGEHSSSFFPGAGRALPAAGPKLAAASQEPPAQKRRWGFSRDFLLGDFLCFAACRALSSQQSISQAFLCCRSKWHAPYKMVFSYLYESMPGSVPSRQREQAQLCPTHAKEGPSLTQQQQGCPTPLGLQPHSLEPHKAETPARALGRPVCQLATAASPQAGMGSLLQSQSSTAGILLCHFVINPCDCGLRCRYWAPLPGWTARYGHGHCRAGCPCLQQALPVPASSGTRPPALCRQARHPPG